MRRVSERALVGATLDHGSGVENPRSDASWLSTFKALWGVLLAYMVFWSETWLLTDVIGAYLRTQVTCDTTGPHATEHCRNHPLDCLPQPPSSPKWSGSPSCGDKDYVLLRQTQTQSTMVSLSTVSQCFAIPVLGAVADVHGRKKVLLLGFAAQLCLLGCIVVSAYVGPAHTLAWLYSGYSITSIVNCFDPVALSMAADSSAGGPEARGAAMAAMFFCKTASLIAAFTLSFVILSLDLTNYQQFWWLNLAAFGACSMIFPFTLKETFAPLAAGEDEGAVLSTLGNIKRNLQEGLHLIWKDRFVGGFFVVILLQVAAAYGTIMVVGGFLLGEFGYAQNIASLAGVAQQPAIIIGVLLAKSLMQHRMVGPYATIAIGIAVTITFGVIMGVSPSRALASLGLSQFLWWLGFFCTGISYGMVDTSRTTIVSLRVKEEHQAKVQGVMQIFYLVGQTLGQFIWGQYIFNAESRGLAAGRGFLISSGLSSLALCLYLPLLAYRRGRLGMTAVTEERSFITTEGGEATEPRR